MEDLKPCELCAFNNPKGSTAALIIRDGKLLLLKRNEEPFPGGWDLPGGYMASGERPEETLRRELREELGAEAILTPMGTFPGTGHWHGREFAVISFAFLADVGQAVLRLNDENSGYRWTPLGELDPAAIAFDSNQAMVRTAKEKFDFDLERVRELAGQLDPTATVHEQRLYRAVLNGHVVKVSDGGKLIGLGWMFPRRTALRHQAVVEDMVVDAAYRGRGLGRRMLEELVGWARDQGVEVIELTTNPGRVAANELYTKFGFELHPTNHYLYRVPPQTPKSALKAGGQPGTTTEVVAPG